VADPKILKGGTVRKTMSQSRSHLSQMHTTNYMPFMREKAAYWKKHFEPIGGAVAPTVPFGSATAMRYVRRRFWCTTMKQEFNEACSRWACRRCVALSWSRWDEKLSSSASPRARSLVTIAGHSTASMDRRRAGH